MPDAVVRHPLFARLYMLMTQHEPAAVTEHRRQLLAGLTGRVLELGAGNGGNFKHYPAGVVDVLAVEPEPYLREKALAAAAAAPVPVTVVEGTADHLPAADASFDAAVACLVLCSVPSQGTALAELRRVLRKHGELRFYEHVLSRKPMLAATQRLVDRAFWPSAFGGCHTARDTAAALQEAGFEIELLAWASLAWMSVEGFVGVLAGLQAHSLGVVTWAASSFVEALASLIVVWRFTGHRTLSESSEARAQRWVAASCSPRTS